MIENAQQKLIIVDADTVFDLYGLNGKRREDYQNTSDFYNMAAALKKVIDTQDIKVVFSLDLIRTTHQRAELLAYFGENNFTSKKCEIVVNDRLDVIETEFWENIIKEKALPENACAISASGSSDIFLAAELAGLHVIKLGHGGSGEQNMQNLKNFVDLVPA